MNVEMVEPVVVDAEERLLSNDEAGCGVDIPAVVSASVETSRGHDNVKVTPVQDEISVHTINTTNDTESWDTRFQPVLLKGGHFIRASSSHRKVFLCMKSEKSALSYRNTSDGKNEKNIPFQGLSIADAPAELGATAFGLVSNSKVMHFVAKSSSERKLWLDAINSALLNMNYVPATEESSPILTNRSMLHRLLDFSPLSSPVRKTSNKTVDTGPVEGNFFPRSETVPEYCSVLTTGQIFTRPSFPGKKIRMILLSDLKTLDIHPISEDGVGTHSRLVQVCDISRIVKLESHGPCSFGFFVGNKLTDFVADSPKTIREWMKALNTLRESMVVDAANNEVKRRPSIAVSNNRGMLQAGHVFHRPGFMGKQVHLHLLEDCKTLATRSVNKRDSGRLPKVILLSDITKVVSQGDCTFGFFSHGKLNEFVAESEDLKKKWLEALSIAFEVCNFQSAITIKTPASGYLSGGVQRINAHVEFD